MAVSFVGCVRTLCVSALLVSSLTVVATAGELVDKIVVIVNEEIITASDIADFERRLKTGGLVDDQLVPNGAAREALLKDREALARKLIDARLIDAEVKKQGLSVTMERVEQEVRSIAKRNKGMTRDDLKNALAAEGIAFSVYQDFLKTGLERQSLVEKSVTSKITISEDDVLAALIAEGRISNTQAFEYSLANIIFLTSKDGGIEGARSRAAAAMAKLKEGVSFDRVHAEYTEDKNFDVGGVLPNMSTGEIPAELERAISKLSPGEWTQPIATDDGLRIVRLIRRRLIPDPRIEKEKDRVRAKLGEERFRRQYDMWLELLRSEATIRFNKKEG